MEFEIRILESPEEMARAASEEFVSQAGEAIRARGRFTVVLSGGSTPRGVYSLLADAASFRARVSWEKVHFFWGDERHVPPDHPESNYRMTEEALLSRIPAVPGHVHRIRGENPVAHRAAEEYEETLRTFFQINPGEVPGFDLVFLGMGKDGHTASLFPRTPALREQRRLVVANWVEELKGFRITMTLPLLNQAKRILFLVSGEEKAETLRTVFEENPEKELPARLVRPARGRCIWLVDRSAAQLLKTI